MKIKTVGIKNLTDARYFAAQGVEWMHFDFRETSNDYILPEQAAAIKDWLEGVKFIGEWETKNVIVLNQILNDTNIKTVQIEEDFPLDTIVNINTATVFRKIFINELTTFVDLKRRIEVSKISNKIVTELVSKHSSFQKLFFEHKNLSFGNLSHLCSQYSISLDIDFNEKDLLLLTELNLFSLCLHGSDEDQIGIKSYDELDEIFSKISHS